MNFLIKKITTLLILASSFLLQAQDFKPYKVKSGEIEYENLKYSTHTVYKSSNGVETGYSEQVPYVSEKTTYYWDNYGDLAFEETYQVSKFGGELLEEPIKVSERLWIGEHRYYLDIKKNKLYDDPYHKRITCKDNFQFYQITGSWVETIYMGAKKMDTVNLLGKDAIHYKIENSHDIYTWKGLLLKEEFYAINRKGDKRLGIDRAKVAIKIDTETNISPDLFNPKWYKNELKYQALNGITIGEMIDGNPKLLKQAHSKKGIEIQKGDLLIFVTTNLFLGKLQVLAIDEQDNLIIRFQLYNSNYGLETNRDYFKIKNNSKLNITEASFEKLVTTTTDFVWKKDKNAVLLPQNNISLFLIKSK